MRALRCSRFWRAPSARACRRGHAGRVARGRHRLPERLELLGLAVLELADRHAEHVEQHLDRALDRGAGAVDRVDGIEERVAQRPETTGQQSARSRRPPASRARSTRRSSGSSGYDTVSAWRIAPRRGSRSRPADSATGSSRGSRRPARPRGRWTCAGGSSSVFSTVRGLVAEAVGAEQHHDLVVELDRARVRLPDERARLVDDDVVPDRLDLDDVGVVAALDELHTRASSGAISARRSSAPTPRPPSRVARRAGTRGRGGPRLSEQRHRTVLPDDPVPSGRRHGASCSSTWPQIPAATASTVSDASTTDHPRDRRDRGRPRARRARTRRSRPPCGHASDRAGPEPPRARGRARRPGRARAPRSPAR